MADPGEEGRLPTPLILHFIPRHFYVWYLYAGPLPPLKILDPPLLGVGTLYSFEQPPEEGN